jgi:hypothetical protein
VRVGVPNGDGSSLQNMMMGPNKTSISKDAYAEHANAHQAREDE